MCSHPAPVRNWLNIQAASVGLPPSPMAHCSLCDPPATADQMAAYRQWRADLEVALLRKQKASTKTR